VHLDSKLPRRNSFGYRTLKMIQKGMSRKSSRSMTMQHQSSAADMFDMLAEHEMDKMSPLIRPKEFRHSFSTNYSPYVYVYSVKVKTKFKFKNELSYVLC